MAHTFEHTLDAWATNGTKSAPSSTLKSTGFVGGMKPPASVFNYQWDKIAKAISELQQYALTEDPSGGIWQNLAAVATSGNYNDLLNKPELKAIATSGSFNDLTNVPGKVVAGQYTGVGKYDTGRPSVLKTNARAITFPFTPSLVLLASSPLTYPFSIMQGYGIKSWGNTFNIADISDNDISYVTVLSGNKLYITKTKNSNNADLDGGDVSGKKYAYAAFA